MEIWKFTRIYDGSLQKSRQAPRRAFLWKQAGGKAGRECPTEANTQTPGAVSEAGCPQGFSSPRRAAFLVGHLQWDSAITPRPGRGENSGCYHVVPLHARAYLPDTPSSLSQFCRAKRKNRVLAQSETWRSGSGQSWLTSSCRASSLGSPRTAGLLSLHGCATFQTAVYRSTLL